MTQEPHNKHFVILGATSTIAIATARLLAARGDRLSLLARNTEALSEVAADLRVRGASRIQTQVLDLANEADPQDVLDELAADGDVIDGILIFYGILGDQAEAERNLTHARDILRVNFTSASDWIMSGAKLLETQSEGVLLAISSVAGDRGRRSNYVYGAAKAGLSVLMQGLAHKWAAKSKKLRAVNMKLGFVDTPMTDGIEKSGPLWAQPEEIARIIVKALQRGGPNIYGPWFWRWIMLAIRVTPSFVFNKVNL